MSEPQTTSANPGSGPATIELGPGATTSELAARAGLFAFLGRSLEAEPDIALLDLIRGPMRKDLEQAGVHFSEQFLAAPSEQLATVLNEEFTCLFVAPGCIPPYASVFETGRMFQGPADRALAAYQQAGMTFQPLHSGEFADHVGVMLGFYAHLLAQQDASMQDASMQDTSGQDTSENDGLSDDAVRWKARGENFLLKQMGTWVPGWCRRAQGFAMHEFYDQILVLTEAVVWNEIEGMASRAQLRELSGLNQREPVKLDYDADFRKASGL